MKAWIAYRRNNRKSRWKQDLQYVGKTLEEAKRMYSHDYDKTMYDARQREVERGILKFLRATITVTK